MQTDQNPQRPVPARKLRRQMLGLGQRIQTMRLREKEREGSPVSSTTELIIVRKKGIYSKVTLLSLNHRLHLFQVWKDHLWDSKALFLNQFTP